MTNPSEISHIPSYKRQFSSKLGTGTVILHGLPGSGKDTHGDVLAYTFNGIKLGGGDILRMNYEMMSDEDKAVFDAGGLVSSDGFFDQMVTVLTTPELRDIPLFLSGVGRKDGEVPKTMETLELAHHALKAVVYISVSPEVILERMIAKGPRLDSNGKLRRDDDPDIIENRIKTFYEETMPVLDQYDDLGLLLEIDGDRPKADVSKDIEQTLASAALHW